MRHPLASVLLTGVFVSAGAQTMPSDIELRAAYCVTVVRHHASFLRAVPPENAEVRELLTKSIAAAESDLNRLLSYLAPKIKTLDLDALTLAQKRSEADIAEAISHARNQTEEQPATRRLAGCRKLDWLPF